MDTRRQIFEVNSAKVAGLHHVLRHGKVQQPNILFSVESQSPAVLTRCPEPPNVTMGFSRKYIYNTCTIMSPSKPISTNGGRPPRQPTPSLCCLCRSGTPPPLSRFIMRLYGELYHIQGYAVTFFNCKRTRVRRSSKFTKCVVTDLHVEQVPSMWGPTFECYPIHRHSSSNRT